MPGYNRLNSNSETLTDLFYSNLFKCMFGIAAVGTNSGHLYIIDLRGDDKEEKFSLLNPSQLLFVEISDISNIAQYREVTLQEGKHLCIDLNCKFQNIYIIDQISVRVMMMVIASESLRPTDFNSTQVVTQHC